MITSFTDFYNIDKAEFNKLGAFDPIINVDTKFFIDPALLSLCEVPEFKGAKNKVEAYFKTIILLIKNSTQVNDMFWKKADKLLTFKEITGTCIGYSKHSTNGNSIGAKLRTTILQNLKILIEKGIESPQLFELLGVFQEDIGCDRISDLITFILAEDIFKYTQRVVKHFYLNTESIKYKDNSYDICFNQFNNTPILLLPKIILSALPIANSFDEIGYVCSENDRIRTIINRYFDFEELKYLSKKRILNLMTTNNEFAISLIQAYSQIPKKPYDLDKNVGGEYIWYTISKKFTIENPIELKKPTRIEELYEIVLRIVEQYKRLIQSNGLEYLLQDNGKPKHEKASQLLFRGIADAYCNANNLDISPEVNNGRGSVDFKLSRGNNAKILVEIKLSKNTNLIHGLNFQLPTYIEQENANKAIYLVINFGDDKKIHNLIKTYNSKSQDFRDKVQLVIVDAEHKPSASVAKQTKKPKS